jgi:hypothetical protein
MWYVLFVYWALNTDCCVGAKLIYLPAYSPDLNPIEQAFSWIKSWLRRHDGHELDIQARVVLLYRAAHALDSDHAWGWILNCGYE